MKKAFEQHRIDLKSKARLEPDSFPKTIEAAAAGACQYERGSLKMNKHVPNAAIFEIEATKEPPVKSKTEQEWSEAKERKKRRRRRSRSRSPDSSSSRSPSPSPEERPPKHPCALCKQKGHLTWKCPWIEHATSAVESAQKDSAKSRRKKRVYATTAAAPPKCRECGHTPGAGPPTCVECEEFEERVSTGPTLAARVNVARTTPRELLQLWNPIGKKPSVW